MYLSSDASLSICGCYQLFKDSMLSCAQMAKSYQPQKRENRRKHGVFIDSLRLGEAYMHQYSRLSLVQMMVCHLFGAKPLSEPKLAYCSQQHWEQTYVKLKEKTAHSIKLIDKCYILALFVSSYSFIQTPQHYFTGTGEIVTMTPVPVK